MRNIIDDNEGDIVSGTDNEKEKGRSEKIWRVLVITILTVVFLYVIYHVFSYFFNGYNTAVKYELTDYEIGIIADELNILISEDVSVSRAIYTGGKQHVIMVWIDNIEDGMEFIEKYTDFDTQSYKSVSLGINQNQSVAARYYSAYKDGDEYPVECYIYKLDSTDKWTAYIIENDVTDKSIKKIFLEDKNDDNYN